MRFFLPREDEFFTLFKRINDEQKEIAQLLKDFSSNFPDSDEYEKRAKEIEKRADTVTHEIIDKLNRTFITPFDREDIYLLANELDDIVDLIENVIHNVGVYAITQKRGEFDQFADLIIEASHSLGKLLDHFQEIKKTDLLTKSKIHIHELEDKGDDIFCSGLNSLFRNEKDAVTLIQWKDILEDLENVMDKYQKVSDIIESIVVKTS